MKIGPFDILFSCGAGLVGVALLVFLANIRSPHRFQPRIPGMDGSPDERVESGEPNARLTAGSPVRGEGKPSTISGTWPWFRGPERDAIGHDGVRLERQWPAGGPPVLWSVLLGEGYAGAAIRDGRVYVLDYDESARADTMRCLSLDDGREIWRNGYPTMIARNHGISRTVPAIVEDCVLSLGPRCHVACWDAESGECRWLMDLVQDHGAKTPRWYAGQCPLVDQGRLILAPCGKALLMAVDYATGDVIWQSPNPRRWEMSHASITPMDFQGRRTYVYCASGGVAGIAADDGALLWDSTEWPVQFAHAPSPLVLPGDRIFLCSGYGNKIGSLVLQLRKDKGQITAEVVQRLTPKQFNSEQQTPILFDGHLFGVRKRGGGQLLCLDLEGNEIWNSGSDRFGHGPYMIADGLILAMDDHGRLVLAEAATSAYRRLASCQVFDDGHDAWGPMALASGRLVLRDMTRMVCLDVSVP